MAVINAKTQNIRNTCLAVFNIAFVLTVFFVGEYYTVPFLFVSRSDYLLLSVVVGMPLVLVFLFCLVLCRRYIFPVFMVLLLLFLQNGGLFTYLTTSMLVKEKTITTKVNSVSKHSMRGSFKRAIYFDCCYANLTTHSLTDSYIPEVDSGDVCDFVVKDFLIQYIVVSATCRKERAT